MTQQIVLFLSLIFFLSSCTSNQEETTNPETTVTQTENYAFPEDWIGHYEGNLEIYNAEKGKMMELPMTVIISETDTLNRWHWYSRAMYNEKEIIKDYHLIRNDSMPKNHFQMDENNGIYLDRVLIDNAFYDYFEIGNSGLYGITRKHGDDIHFEIASFSLNSKTYSTYQGSEFKVDTVTSFKVVNTQKVLLKRVKDK